MLKFNSWNKKYKTPFGAVSCGEVITFTFPIDKNVSPDEVFIIVRKQERSVKYQLPFLREEDGFAVYRTSFSLQEAGIYYYRFEVNCGGLTHFVGKGIGGYAVNADWLPEFQLTVYEAGFEGAKWLNGGLIYHIFPDRFARVKDNQTPLFGYLKHWHEDVTVVDDDGVFRANDFFGGNIKGVISKIDYLVSLGVSAIYFSPIFESSSNHRYDTADYMKIDSLFGTEEEFSKLIEKCKSAGIEIILDGVFNHTGADSIYFNKFNHYNSVGAYQSLESKYNSWYTFTDFPDTYKCWWDITVVPTIARESEGYQALIAGKNGVIDKWTKMGVKGWRLDVVDELSANFVEKIRDQAKSHGDVAVIGEVWEDASTKVAYSEQRNYLFGKQLDGVMNYPYRTAIINYVKGGAPHDFKIDIMTIAENYPMCVLNNCMTLLGTHDTIRTINELSDVVQPEDRSERLWRNLSSAEYYTAKRRLHLASILQYILPGVPTVYYGDEVGMQGWQDPVNRRTYPAIIDTDILEHYKKLGAFRKAYSADLTSDIEIHCSGGVLKITRGRLTITANNSWEPLSLGSEVYDEFSHSWVTEVAGMSAIITK
ncbi:MAG: glycoside hydrolase family 13 protein [Bacillota bacterium]